MKVISEYTRAQAVADGVLVKVPEKFAEECGFRGTFYVAQGLNEKINSEAQKRYSKTIGLSTGGAGVSPEAIAAAIRRSAMITANGAVFREAERSESSSVLSFEWRIYNITLMISVEKNPQEGVVWTLMLPSDY